MYYSIRIDKTSRPISNKYEKYQWPANKLTDKEMAILYAWREQTQTPINYLLAQAVNLMDKVIKEGVTL